MSRLHTRYVFVYVVCFSLFFHLFHSLAHYIPISPCPSQPQRLSMSVHGDQHQDNTQGDGLAPPPDPRTGQQNAGPPPTNFAWINDEDLNGECFLAGEVGEREELQTHRVVGFLPASPSAANPLDVTVFSNPQAGDFIWLNTVLHANAKNRAPTVEDVTIALVRLFAARSGLISYRFQTEQFHVKYNEARLCTTQEVLALRTQHANINMAALMPGDEVRTFLRQNFANYTCAVAYMFRVRGHHWQSDMDAKYSGLWKKCLKNQDNPGLSWEVVAHDATHAIFPSILDDYWKECVANGRIAGALVKRFESAPAGVAAIRAVYAGAQDLAMAMPGIKHKFAEHYADLDAIIENMRVNRWAGSINRRYYGAAPIAFDEQKFGAIASVIYNALMSFASDSQLLKSNALIRVANNAPITGGIISKNIATAVQDPAIVRSMLQIPSTQG